MSRCCVEGHSTLISQQFQIGIARGSQDGGLLGPVEHQAQLLAFGEVVIAVEQLTAGPQGRAGLRQERQGPVLVTRLVHRLQRDDRVEP